MKEMISIMLIGAFFGTFGTTIGGIIGIINKNDTDKFISFVLSLSAGLMFSVVSFELIPESLIIGDISITIVAILLGIFCITICDIFVKKKIEINEYKVNFSEKYKKEVMDKKRFIKTGIIIALGLGIHNFPEGIAIGSGMDISRELGIALAITICLHDIPEGISMAVPLKKGGMKHRKILIYILLSGMITGIGALIGGIVGKISNEVISMCLSFASGAMIYIVVAELIPTYTSIYKGKITSIGNIIGIILGLILTTV